MAFSSFNNQFTRMGPQNDNAPTFWSYKTTDALTTVDGSGYFNAIADRLKVGDVIFAYKSSSTVAAGFAYVVSNTRDLTASPPVSGVVDVTNFTAIGTINSD